MSLHHIIDFVCIFLIDAIGKGCSSIIKTILRKALIRYRHQQSTSSSRSSNHSIVVEVGGVFIIFYPRHNKRLIVDLWFGMIQSHLTRPLTSAY